jgi:hypothetical protein
VRLAWHASGTYDKASNTGGSNGATMRFPTEANDGANAGLDLARKILEPIKAKYPWITYADLWTLAGAVAIESMGGEQCSLIVGLLAAAGGGSSNDPYQEPGSHTPTCGHWLELCPLGWMFVFSYCERAMLGLLVCFVSQSQSPAELRKGRHSCRGRPLVSTNRLLCRPLLSAVLRAGPTIPWRPGRVDKVDPASCPPNGRLPDASQV